MSTFYNVRKSLIQAFRILFAAMLFVVAIGTVCPDIARAENLPESTQINEFAQSDEARTQTLALMEAVQNDGSPEASTQIAIGYADKVHYLRYDDSGAITNTITDPQDYDWVAPVEVEGRLVGRITIWDNNGSLEVGNFSPDIEEASLLDDDDSTTLISDGFSRAYYSMENSRISPLNEAARAIVPESVQVEQGDIAIRKNAPSGFDDSAGGGSIGVVSSDTAMGTDSSMNIFMLMAVFIVVTAVLALMCRILWRSEPAERSMRKRQPLFSGLCLAVFALMSGCTGAPVQSDDAGAHLEFRAYAESGTVRIESQSETVLETRIKGDWLKVAPDDWLENDRPLTFTVERDSGGVEDNVSCEIIFSGHTIDERRVTGPETSATCQYDTWRDAIDY